MKGQRSNGPSSTLFCKLSGEILSLTICTRKSCALSAVNSQTAPKSAGSLKDSSGSVGNLRRFLQVCLNTKPKCRSRRFLSYPPDRARDWCNATRGWKLASCCDSKERSKTWWAGLVATSLVHQTETPPAAAGLADRSNSGKMPKAICCSTRFCALDLDAILPAASASAENQPKDRTGHTGLMSIFNSAPEQVLQSMSAGPRGLC